MADGNALTRTDLPPGEIPGISGNILIQFSVQIGAGVPGCTTLNNVAQVATVSAEEGAYANIASASATVPPPELAVAKSGLALARPGNRVSWNVTWVNQSPQAAADVYLVDTLPNNDADSDSDVTFVSVAPPSGVTPYYHAGPVTPVPVFDPGNPLAGGWSATPTTPVPPRWRSWRARVGFIYDLELGVAVSLGVARFPQVFRFTPRLIPAARMKSTPSTSPIASAARSSFSAEPASSPRSAPSSL